MGDPTSPYEVGTGFSLGMSAYDMVVRDQYVAGVLHRFAYLAVGNGTQNELAVLDIDPANPKTISQAALCSLPGAYQGTSVYAIGNTVYVGRNKVPSGSPDLYAFDASNPLSSSFCSSILGQADVDTGGSSRHVNALRVSGPYLFAATDNTTSSRGQLQIRSSDPASGFPLIGSYDVAPNSLSLADLDFDSDTGNIAAIISGATPSLQVFTTSQ